MYVFPRSDARSADLSVEVLTTSEAVEALEPEWRLLHERSGSGLPFDTPEWTLCWWRTLRESSAAIEDRLAVRAFRAAGSLVAVAPLMATERPAFGPLRLRTLQFVGADPNVTEMRSLLCEPAWEDGVVAALLADLEARASEWDFALWHTVAVGSHAQRRLQASPSRVDVRWLAETPSYVLDLKPSWDELRAGMGRNLKEALRKASNAPKRDGLEVQVEVARGRGPVLAALEVFLRLHRMRAEADMAVRHANAFDSAPAQDFLREVCGRFAERDQALVFVVRLSGVPAAVRIAFRFGRTLHLYYSGFDPAFGRYSVATTAVASAVRWAIDERLTRVCFSTGRDESKLRWRPREAMLRDALLFSSRRGAVAYDAYQRLRVSGVSGPLRAVLARRQTLASQLRSTRPWQAAAAMSLGVLRGDE